MTSGDPNLVEYKNNEMYPTFTYSLLDNFISGQVYMDGSDKSALIRTDSGIFVVAGEQINNNFHNLILEIYEDRNKENQ
ncbi:hypothetical protein [Neobacillus ginsengisoli]|uniref:Uncharacterized protein n=1 Tax=Neobacillus ginsengisoli TaxID=904295 RepID=A0ABT9XRQ5_9BACI|nr:hypothetical protein [Neobacillus ginsengisoli]MDQ0198246.1 hypothetical protein [Neobacillus ginsengisoli]